MEPAPKCAKCGAATPKGMQQVCTRCGWDSQIGMRKCTQCQGAIILDEKLGFGPIGGMAGLTGFVFWYLFGRLIGGALACAAGALCGLLSALTMKYACAACGKPSEARFRDAEEKETFKKRRIGFILGACGLGALSFVLILTRIALFRRQFDPS